MRPKLIIHGGLGGQPASPARESEVRESLRRIAGEAYAFLQSHSAAESVVYATSLLEDDPLFNAGTGSKLQSDGVIRMTASVMDGARHRFAAVINIREVKNPVQVAALLLEHDDRALAGEEALAFARARGFPPHNPETAARRKDYEQKLQGKHGTVGAVTLDGEGRLAAATSTGGKGFEIPGRVSDSGGVAGNYADSFAAVSCTGTGEDIVDAAVAARIVTRVADGMPLAQASDKTLAEAGRCRGHVGIIAADAKGSLYQAAVEPYLAWAIHDGTLTLFGEGG